MEGVTSDIKFQKLGIVYPFRIILTFKMGSMIQNQGFQEAI